MCRPRRQRPARPEEAALTKRGLRPGGGVDLGVKAAHRNRKRGSSMTLEEAQRTGYKTFVSLKGDATAKESKKGWLNPFSDE